MPQKSKFDQNPVFQVAETGVFESFWDTITFSMNGLVFFFAGASCLNFFVRSAQELYDETAGFSLLAGRQI